eukprot:jgi/Botrbrau1/20293/Bobra.31_1s0071.1
MGKNDFLTPKAIANRIKSKGLQKLRWYCQMCQKQCRDENGFKCHLTSESHKRQMMVFGEAPDRVIEGYSDEFLKAFMDHLKVAHPHARVSAKVVYNEFIADRHHIHMNSTKWYTLTDFVKFLGREGLCKVDETPKGWFISLIHRDPVEEIEEQKRLARRKAEKTEEERVAAAIEEQAERARLQADPEAQVKEEDGATEFKREEDAGPLRLALGGSARPPPVAKLGNGAAPGLPPVFREDAGGGTKRKAPDGSMKPKSQVELLMEEEQAKKKAREARARDSAAAAASSKPVSTGRRDDPWLHLDLVVKVLSPELKEQGYYKKKGKVIKLVSKYLAQIQMLDSGDILQVDQAQLETVLPSEGGRVLLLKGPHYGKTGEMLGVDTDKFQAHVKVKGGADLWLEYEDICKLI